MRLHSKVAIVTGSAQGIGESIATLFAQEGASVVLLDTLQAEGQKLETSLQNKGLSVVFIPMDVTDQTAWTNAVNTTIQRFGKVDILVNNAAIRDRSDIENTSEEDWDKVMEQMPDYHKLNFVRNLRKFAEFFLQHRLMSNRSLYLCSKTRYISSIPQLFIIAGYGITN